MAGIFDQPDASATPLSAEEQRHLKLNSIATRDELNAAEQDNILSGREWALGRKRNLLTEGFVRELHRRMLGDVWTWAGDFRTSQRNLGIDYWEVQPSLRMLLDDAKAWIENRIYPPDEIAVRFHHRLVQIHPFPNGNGRHARLMADLLVRQSGGIPFSWGGNSLTDPSALRKRYIAALQAADRHDIQPLLEFARS